MITDTVFYSLAIPALLLTSISKGGFGSGMGVLVVPLMALELPLREVTAIMLPIICLMDVASIWAYRRRWDRPILCTTLPGGLLGILLGSVSFGVLPEVWLHLIVGLTAFAFPLQRSLARGRRRAIADGHERFQGSPGGVPGDIPGGRPWDGRLSALQGVLWATLSGFTSVLANAGELPFSIYLLALRLDKTRLVGTTAVFFAAVNFAKLLPFALLGLFTMHSLLTSLLLSPVAVAGIGLGLWLHRRVDAETFYRISYVLLLALGTKFTCSSLISIL
jgi:uncharacterized membrane protein YfcA